MPEIAFIETGSFGPVLDDALLEVLDEDVLGTAAAPEPIVASPIVADGRIYVTTMDALYAIGKRVPRAARAPAAPVAPVAPGAPGAPGWRGKAASYP